MKLNEYFERNQDFSVSRTILLLKLEYYGAPSAVDGITGPG